MIKNKCLFKDISFTTTDEGEVMHSPPKDFWKERSKLKEEEGNIRNIIIKN
jgi:hypothetical protein